MNFLKCLRSRHIIAFFFTINAHQLAAQNITPFTFNNGGGSNASMEWSIAESVSIAYFIAPGFFVNTGVLQPMTNNVTAINVYGPAVFGSQITIGPNPTNNSLLCKTRFAEAGSLTFQILDAKSSIVLTHEVGSIFRNYERTISLGNYPAGVYYMKVLFKPITGNIKTGIYKIIKL
jgi:hypothetical protein